MDRCGFPSCSCRRRLRVDTRIPALAVEVHGDFNDDGKQDVAIGAPGEGVGSARGAGSVTVTYGGQPAARLFDQDSHGIPGAAERDDRFGAAL